MKKYWYIMSEALVEVVGIDESRNESYILLFFSIILHDGYNISHSKKN